MLLCRDKKLAAIKVNKEDVDIIAAEFELDTKTADRRLREHSGNLVEALQSFLGSQDGRQNAETVQYTIKVCGWHCQTRSVEHNDKQPVCLCF